MHEKKYAVLCRRKLGKILVFLVMLLGLVVAFKGSAQPVYADDAPTSLGDVAAHYANAGMKWANTDKSDANKYNVHAIKPWQKAYSVWNFLGPGKHSILTSESADQKVVTYSALKSNVNSKVSSNVENAARFSFAMSEAGLDHPRGGGLSPITKIGRFICDWVTIFLVYLSFLGGKLLHVVFKLFQWLNVFYILQNLVGNNVAGKDNFFAEIAKQLQPLYKLLSSLSTAFLLLSLGFGILISYMGFRQQGHQEGLGANLASKVMRKVGQICVIFVFPIFIGVISADLTSRLDSAMDVSSNISLKEVYGNYIDFSAWATHSRLALPNKGTMGTPLATTDQLNISGTNAFSEDYVNAINAYGGGLSVPTKIATGNYKTKLSDVNQTVAFLARHSHGDTMTGDKWKSTFEGRLRKKIRGVSGDKLTGSVKGSKAKNPSISKSDALTNPYQAISSDIYGDYGNSGDYDNAANCIFFSDGSLDTYNIKGNTYYTSNSPKNPGGSDLAAIGDSSEAGLSSIGLYNYLNIDGSSGNYLSYTSPKGFHGLSGINQHANEGFIGRGIMAGGTYFKMLALIATSGLIIAFAGVIILKGLFQNIPNILKDAIQLGVGSFAGMVTVIQEMINLYARVVIGSLIVYLFQGSLPAICTKLESLLVKAMTGSSAIVIGGVNLLPFASMNTSILGVIRIIEAVAIWLIMYAIVRSFDAILKFIDNLTESLLDSIRKTRLGSRMLPPNPSPGMAGMNNTTSNNTSNNTPMGNDPYGNPNKFNDDTPDNSDDIRNRMHDPEQNFGQDSQKFGHTPKQQASMAALDALDAVGNSKAGQLAKKGASLAGGALAGSKLGKALGMKGRGEGLAAADKAEQRLRQSLSMAADPMHANNTAKAGMSEAQRKASAAQEQHAQQMASAAGVEQAKNEQKAAKQAKKDIVDQFKSDGVGADGKAKSELKDPANVNRVVDAMQDQDALSPKGKAAVKQMSDLAEKQAKDAKARTQDYEQAVADAQKAYDEDPSEANKEKLKRANNKLKASELVSDPAKRAMFEHANKRAVTPNGVGLRAASSNQIDAAKKRRFTALTGKDAATGVAATPEQLAKAANVAAGAQKILTKPNISQSMRAKATQDLQAAQLVMDTGMQYGQYATPAAQASLKAATPAAIQQAKQYQQVDQATIATGMVATNNAPRLSPAESTYIKKLDNARSVISTGRIMSNGHSRVASPQQISMAQQTLASDPAKQVDRIQARMMSTTSTVMAEARSYAQRTVAGSEGVGRVQLAHMRHKAETLYLQKPEVQQQLKASGLVNTSNPQRLQQQIVRVQKMDDKMREGLSESLEPIRAQIRKMPSTPDRLAIKEASENQYDHLYASSRIVDSAHYQTTTNQQVRKATQHLLNAYHSKDRDRIIEARAQAAKIGMANPVINSQKKLQETERAMREQRNSVVNNATSLTGSLSDSIADIQEAMSDYGEVESKS